jgi:molybdate transport system substrate-binding protein
VKRLLALALLTSIALSACGPAPASRPGSGQATNAITVFAAASLTESFSEIGAAFEAANPGARLTFNFAGSQTLRTQIEQGAAADVFASANTDQMDALVADGMVDPEAPRIFLTNELVVILPPNNPAQLRSLQDLARPGLKLVLAAGDVPVGSYSRQALDNLNAVFGADFKDKVIANVASNEDNVKQVVTKTQLGEADAGIVYASDAIAAPDLKTIEIPAPLNVIARYPIAVLAHAPNRPLAQGFTAFVLSADGQAILHKWGFRPGN